MEPNMECSEIHLTTYMAVPVETLTKIISEALTDHCVDDFAMVYREHDSLEDM